MICYLQNVQKRKQKCKKCRAQKGMAAVLEKVILETKMRFLVIKNPFGEKIFFDDVEADAKTVQKAGWYMGRPLYSGKLIKREVSMRKALNYAVNKYHKYESIDGIIQDFGLTPGILDYGLSRNCNWEKWRASLAIGYASDRTIYCFPWMNSLTFYDCLYNSAVFQLFRRLRSEGAIIILPTSRRENVEGFVDEIIQSGGQRFEQVISDSEYFKEYF